MPGRAGGVAPGGPHCDSYGKYSLSETDAQRSANDANGARRQAAQASGLGCPPVGGVRALVFGNIALNSDLRGGHAGSHFAPSTPVTGADCGRARAPFIPCCERPAGAFSQGSARSHAGRGARPGQLRQPAEGCTTPATPHGGISPLAFRNRARSSLGTRRLIIGRRITLIRGNSSDASRRLCARRRQPFGRLAL